MNQDRVMLLIDADNLSVDVIDQAVRLLLNQHGGLHVRRAYCTAESAVKHQAEFKRLGIKPMVNLATGKNSTDIAMAIDAIDLVLAERPHVVVIASSDSDFAPLVQRLREKGCVVRGIGQEGKTGAETQEVYDDFTVLEHRRSGTAAGGSAGAARPARKAAARKTAARRTAPRKAAADPDQEAPAAGGPAAGDETAGTSPAPARKSAVRKTVARKSAARKTEAGRRAAPARKSTAAQAAADAAGLPAEPPAAELPEPASHAAGAKRGQHGERHHTAPVAPSPAAVAAPAAPAAPAPAAPAAPAPAAPAAPAAAAAAAAAAAPRSHASRNASSGAARQAATSADAVLACLPELVRGQGLALNVAAQRLREAQLLSKNNSSLKLFAQLGGRFELLPPSKPTQVRLRR